MAVPAAQRGTALARAFLPHGFARFAVSVDERRTHFHEGMEKKELALGPAASSCLRMTRLASVQSLTGFPEGGLLASAAWS